MPELPDVLTYCQALRTRIVGRVLTDISIRSPFVLRTVEPAIEDAAGRGVVGVDRIGKRIVLDFGDERRLVIHLMIAGRLRWNEKPPLKLQSAALRFETDVLHVTEASREKRASLHYIADRASLAAFARGGLDVLTADEAAFCTALRKENHTLKRSLTDPRLFDGIGNAYSDEILHAARLSPIAHSQKATDEEVRRLFEATRRVLNEWIARLGALFAQRFPGAGEITAFRPEFAVHGKFNQPCPVCGTAVQRIIYAANETNYCPTCQTGGRVLADRSLSRLLKDDWPRTVAELEGP
ncbi:MAG: DNA-formamidopyrimidine glycosylase family protein [Phycisphaerae bacterium]|nr:DNA-formamidopyrimidine glycosylase family protein [Phycisphaerae bacterium]